jgi:hypothetical protein
LPDLDSSIGLGVFLFTSFLASTIKELKGSVSSFSLILNVDGSRNRLPIRCSFVSSKNWLTSIFYSFLIISAILSVLFE